MPLTLEQAAQAGVLAGHITRANEAIASFENRIANAKGAISISARLDDDTQITENFPLTAKEMAGLYEYLRDLVTTKRDGLQTLLNAITIE